MFGAIYGDVIGSYYESHCTKDFYFPFQEESTFTDDTVLTVATCQAILRNDKDITGWQLRKRGYEYAVQYRHYYAMYPSAGFGNKFSQWAKDHCCRITRSFANGGAMRVIPIGYAYSSLPQVLLQAKASCYYTHHHKEAVKAAQAVAASVFLARCGESKERIKAYLEKTFHYDLSPSIEEIRKIHVFNSQASYSVPAALIAFLQSCDYEETIRNAVSIGGDADTEACIAGGIAEAYYREIPKHISDFCNLKIDTTLKNVVKEFVKNIAKFD